MEKTRNNTKGNSESQVPENVVRARVLGTPLNQKEVDLVVAAAKAGESLESIRKRLSEGTL